MNDKPLTETQKFTSDIAWVAISQALLAISGFIILPFLTKYYSSDIYGVWTQIWVTIGLLSPILTLQFGTSLVRFLAAEEDRKKRCRAFSTMLWPILGFICLVLLISLPLRHNLSMLLFADPKYIYFIPLTFLWASMEALFMFSLSYLRARGRIKRLSIIEVAFSIAKMGLIVALAIVGYSPIWIIIGIILCTVVFVAMVSGMIIREIGPPKPVLEGLKGYLAFSIPQIPAGALIWVINSSDRYFITHLLSISQTGIYSASYTLGTVLLLFFGPIGIVLLPMVSKLWELKALPRVKAYFEYSTKLSLTFAIPGAVGLYLLSQPLLRILATPEYMAGGGLVLLIALGMVFFGIYNLNVYIVYLVKQTKWLPLMIGIAALTNAGINIALIPKVGIMGAAISTIVAYFVLAAIVTAWAMKAINYKMDIQFLSKVIVASIVMAFCLSFIEIGSILDIIITVIAGAVIFGLGLFLLKAFSREDSRLIREVLSSLHRRL